MNDAIVAIVVEKSQKIAKPTYDQKSYRCGDIAMYKKEKSKIETVANTSYFEHSIVKNYVIIRDFELKLAPLKIKHE